MDNKRLQTDDFYEFLRTDLRDTQVRPIISPRFMLLFVEHGSATLKVDEKTFRMGTLNFLFVHPLVEVSCVKASPDFRADVIYLKSGLTPLVENHIEPSFFMFVLQHQHWTMDRELSHAAMHFCGAVEFAIADKGNPHRRDVITSLFNAFFYTFYYKVSAVYRQENAPREFNAQYIFERFVQELHTHIMEEHSVAYYADLLCISPKYLTQITKRIIRHTPKEIINRQLAKASLVALRKSNMTVQEISNKLGFPDQSYFGRFFKRMFGVSPMYYRQNPHCLSDEQLSV